jgi:hypothetical protein
VNPVRAGGAALRPSRIHMTNAIASTPAICRGVASASAKPCAAT